MYFFFQAEDGILDQVRSRGLGEGYKRQWIHWDSIPGFHRTLAQRTIQKQDPFGTIEEATQAAQQAPGTLTCGFFVLIHLMAALTGVIRPDPVVTDLSTELEDTVRAVRLTVGRLCMRMKPQTTGGHAHPPIQAAAEGALHPGSLEGDGGRLTRSIPPALPHPLGCALGR